MYLRTVSAGCAQLNGPHGFRQRDFVSLKNGGKPVETPAEAENARRRNQTQLARRPPCPPHLHTLNTPHHHQVMELNDTNHNTMTGYTRVSVNTVPENAIMAKNTVLFNSFSIYIVLCISLFKPDLK